MYRSSLTGFCPCTLLRTKMGFKPKTCWLQARTDRLLFCYANKLIYLQKNGFCNGDCLSRYASYNGPDSSINCFLKKIRFTHRLLHWGIDFNDPVHIDDRVCTSAANWDKIHNTLSGCLFKYLLYVFACLRSANKKAFAFNYFYCGCVGKEQKLLFDVMIFFVIWDMLKDKYQLTTESCQPTIVN